MTQWLLEWIPQVMERLSYFGIGLLMFLENLFPPIPSELIMPLAGFTVSKGELNFQYAVLAGVIGTVIGALPWYYIGKLFGESRIRQLADRYGKWLTISGEDISKANHWFHKRGGMAVLLCRLVPGVRTLISVPAGINAMPIGAFILYSTIGTALWCTLLTYSGYVLGQNYGLVETYLGPISKYILIGLLLVAGGWIWRRRQTQKHRP
ncbi:DedA family protein [filamentous cyanobacterium LEGE 11480]|uniref:DedA family protein n=1 Tax=Romeriopsis navalis LEGE 11480 TaxID=2777977 RepID=A0A928Z2E2_9CYAN|nr:DedA family protein [Romeriopsis navalis]MBE9029449.1 DedA family protein [Romeriopsis navalis LEGE 11480]